MAKTIRQPYGGRTKHRETLPQSLYVAVEERLNFRSAVLSRGKVFTFMDAATGVLPSHQAKKKHKQRQ